VIRLEAPGPGVALIATSGAGPQVIVSVNLYFYGDEAAARASASEPRWQAWLAEQSASQAYRTSLPG
jgi:hypothetical protein